MINEKDAVPIYSHNPYEATKFPLLVLDVERQSCKPYNEGFRVFHWHDEVQFVYILKGVVHFRIYDEEVDLKAGDCMFINQAALHQIMEKEDCHYHSYIVPVRMLSFFPGSIMEERDVASIVNHPCLTHFAMQEEDEECANVLEEVRGLDRMYFDKRLDMHRIDRAAQTGHLEYRLSIQLARIWLELIESLSKAAAENRLGGPGDMSVGFYERMDNVAQVRSHERIRVLLAYVHDNYARDISLKNIAEAASISQTECQRCFRSYVQCAPYQYLLRYRLDRSSRMLVDSNDTVTEIAMNVGFHSVSAYIKYFKKFYGMTPSKYRKENESRKNSGKHFF